MNAIAYLVYVHKLFIPSQIYLSFCQMLKLTHDCIFQKKIKMSEMSCLQKCKSTRFIHIVTKVDKLQNVSTN